MGVAEQRATCIVVRRPSIVISHKAGGRVDRAEPRVLLHMWPHTDNILRDMKARNANLDANTKMFSDHMSYCSVNLRPQRKWLPTASRIVPDWVSVGVCNGADGELSRFIRRFLPSVLVVLPEHRR